MLRAARAAYLHTELKLAEARLLHGRCPSSCCVVLKGLCEGLLQQKCVGVGLSGRLHSHPAELSSAHTTDDLGHERGCLLGQQLAVGSDLLLSML